MRVGEPVGPCLQEPLHASLVAGCPHVPARRAVRKRLRTSGYYLPGPLWLGGGEPQAGAELVGLDLDDAMLVALGRLPGAGPQPPDHHHPIALGQRVGHMLGEVAPDVDPEARGLSVLPAVPLPEPAG